MKTSELIGPALDWAVAVAKGAVWQGPSVRPAFFIWPTSSPSYSIEAPPYSTEWMHGGPIIEREKIDTYYSAEKAAWTAAVWRDLPGGGQLCAKQTGAPTALVAAMRCFVAIHLGDEVDVPKELL